MPVRNGEAFLLPALQSVLGQTLTDFELIVVDDGSTDRTPDLLAACSDPRLRVLRGPGRGISRALNLALESSSAPYVARMDADDECLPDRLARQLRAMEADSSVGVVGCSFEVIDPAGEHVAYRGVPLDDEALRSTLTGWSPFCHGSVMMRREVVVRAGGYDPAWEPAEDYELWVRLAQRTRLAAVPEVLYRHRSSPESVSATSGDQQRDRARQLAQQARRLIAPARVPPVLPALRSLPPAAAHRAELIEATLSAAELGARRLRDRGDRAGALRTWCALSAAALRVPGARRVLVRRVGVLVGRASRRRGRAGSTGT
jgi:cellulose synthase/poly-beta-1,6-N-acetylglucosamine synthase-like glycosyltransferase